MAKSLEFSSLYLDSRDKLKSALYDAGELEHQLLLQYLYAALSLKKDPDERCSPSRLEFVRRWASVLHMLARHEMAHMALIGNILLGLGAAPSFDCQNILPRGLISPYFLVESLAAKGRCASAGQPADVPFSLARFDLRTVRRLVCLENPKYIDLEAEHVPRWCYHASSGQWLCTSPSLDIPVGKSHLDPAILAHMRSILANSGYEGLTQILYCQIRQAIHTLPELFTNPRPQVYLRPRSHIYVVPVTGRASADTALGLIFRNGEGLYGEPGYGNHFMVLCNICEELARLLDEDPDFEPARPLLSNPVAEQISDPFTRAVFELSQFTYLTLLFALTPLYQNYVPGHRAGYPFFSAALEHAALAPLMVMVMRSLGEILACLDIGDGVHTVGPCLAITPQARALLVPGEHGDTSTAPELLDIDFHRDRCQHIRDRVRALADNVPAGAPAWIRGSLEHMFQRAHLMIHEMVQIYQNGEPRRL